MKDVIQCGLDCSVRETHDKRGTTPILNAVSYRVVLEKLQGIGKEYFHGIQNDLVTFRVCG